MLRRNAGTSSSEGGGAVDSELLLKMKTQICLDKVESVTKHADMTDKWVLESNWRFFLELRMSYVGDFRDLPGTLNFTKRIGFSLCILSGIC